MNKQGRAIWASSQGGDLMETFLQGGPLTEQDEKTLKKLHKAEKETPEKQQEKTKK